MNTPTRMTPFFCTVSRASAWANVAVAANGTGKEAPGKEGKASRHDGGLEQKSRRACIRSPGALRNRTRESTLGRPKTRNNRNILMPVMIGVHGSLAGFYRVRGGGLIFRHA